jgi:hypothetical protein
MPSMSNVMFPPVTLHGTVVDTIPTALLDVSAPSGIVAVTERRVMTPPFWTLTTSPRTTVLPKRNAKATGPPALHGPAPDALSSTHTLAV